MKKVITFLCVFCILLGTGFSAYADTEGTVYAEAPLMTGLGEGEGTYADEAALQYAFWNPRSANAGLAMDRMMDAFDNLDTSVDITDCYISMDDFSALYFGMLYDHPEYFYVKLSYQFSYSLLGRTVTTVNIFYLNTYRKGSSYDFDLIRKHREAFDLAVDQALAAIPDGLSDLETVLFVHEYLGTRVYYDYDNLLTDTLPDQVFTAYGTLVDEVAVCQGYSLAMNLLCREEGVATEYVTSIADNHGWSMVNLDGKWYHVDMTYNDPVYTSNGSRLYNSVLKHSYFLISDEDVNDGDHDNFALPENRSAKAPSAAETMQGIWQDQTGAMVYHDGFWYYTDDDDIVRSRIDGGARSVVIKDAGEAVRLSTDGAHLLYSTLDGVYAAEFDGTGKTRLYAANAEKIRGLYYENGEIQVEVLTTDGNLRAVRNLAYAGNIDAELPDINEEEKPAQTPAAEGSGDLDGDGTVQVADILCLKNLIMNANWTSADMALADMDGDGALTVGDIIAMKNIIIAA